MPYLPERALPDVFPPFAALRQGLGLVPNLFKAQTLLPRAIEVEAEIAGAVLLKEAGLTRVQKELILLSLAAADANVYCLTVHWEFLRRLGLADELIRGAATEHHRARLSAPDVVLLDCAMKLGRHPTRFTAHDAETLRRAGFDDAAILEAILMCGLTSFLCTLAVGLGPSPDFSPKSVPSRALGAPPASAPLVETLGPYLRTVDLGGEQFPPFAFFKERLGFVPNIFRAQGLRPDVIEAEAKTVGAVLLTDDVLRRKQKEYILLVVSAANLNTYCVAVHCEMLRGLGIPDDEADQIALNHRDAGLPAADTALLDFALKLGRRAPDYGPGDIEGLRAAGFTDPQILEAVVMVALTNFLNTIQMGLGPQADFEPRLLFRRDDAVNPAVRVVRPITGDASSPAGTGTDRDADLVARARQGDMRAFEELVRHHHRRVYRTLVGVTGNHDDAEDGLQSVFLKVFDHLADFAGQARFSTWLTRIAINEGVQVLRRRKRFESLDETTSEAELFEPRRVQAWAEDAEHRYSQKETRDLLERELVRLPPKYRLAVVLRDLEDFSTEEAAECLGLGIPTLKTRLLRGRLMLREALAPHFTKGAVGRA